MDESPSNQPDRYHELVKVHGRLDPLVNINLKPDTHVKVQVSQDRLENPSFNSLRELIWSQELKCSQDNLIKKLLQYILVTAGNFRFNLLLQK